MLSQMDQFDTQNTSQSTAHNTNSIRSSTQDLEQTINSEIGKQAHHSSPSKTSDKARMSRLA